MKNIETKFPLGQTVATRGVHETMNNDSKFKDFCFKSLMRHCSGDWGDISDEDKRENDNALEQGERILSAYNYASDNSKKIWIITEWDRSVTTILFPDEY